jgi:hypothetical protein
MHGHGDERHVPWLASLFVRRSISEFDASGMPGKTNGYDG